MDDIFLNRLLAMFQQLLGSATTSKNKIEITIGSHNKNKDGKQINGLLNVIGVSEKFLKNSIDDVIEELRKTCTSIEEALKSSGETITSQLQNVILTKFTERIADISKSNIKSLQTEINIQLIDIVMQIKSSIANELKGVIDRQEATLNSQEKIEKALSEYNSQLNREITSLSRLCEDILHNVQLAKEILGEKIDDCKELISKFMQEAELRNKELLNKIQRISSKGSNEEENELEAHSLDLSTLAKMFDVIKEINEKQTTGESVNELIVNSVNEVNIRCIQIQSDIGKIRECTDEGYKKADEILHLTREGNEGAKEANNKLEVLQRQLNEVHEKLNKISTEYQAVADCQAKMDSAISNDEREKLECELEKLRTQLNETLHELEIATSTGEMSAILPCRYCGTKAERKIIGGECVCTVCGHRYHLDPNISDKQIETDIQKVCGHNKMDEESDMAVTWKELHTAELEEVSIGVRSGLYRMKLGKYTVSSNGVLIIPNKTWDDRKVTEIAFCQPNTCDKEGLEQLSRVRTLFLSEGIKVTEYGGEKPFSQIKGLEKIMKWDGNGYVVDEELSPQSKRIVS